MTPRRSGATPVFRGIASVRASETGVCASRNLLFLSAAATMSRTRAFTAGAGRVGQTATEADALVKILETPEINYRDGLKYASQVL